MDIFRVVNISCENNMYSVLSSAFLVFSALVIFFDKEGRKKNPKFQIVYALTVCLAGFSSMLWHATDCLIGQALDFSLVFMVMLLPEFFLRKKSRGISSRFLIITIFLLVFCLELFIPQLSFLPNAFILAYVSFTNVVIRKGFKYVWPTFLFIWLGAIFWFIDNQCWLPIHSLWHICTSIAAYLYFKNYLKYV